MATEKLSTKQCTLCQACKPVSLFSPRKQNKDGLYSWCKTCSAARAKEWASKNKERVVQSTKARYWADPVAARAKRTAQYRAKTGDGPAKKRQEPVADESGCLTLACTKCVARKPTSEFYQRDGGFQSMCKACVGRRTAAYVETRKERVSEYKRQWREENADRLKDAKRARYRANSASIGEKAQEYAKAHPDRVRGYKNKWKKDNPHRLREYGFLRCRTTRQATPSWASRSAMLVIYRAARQLTAQTGIDHHVDHIVPLRSRFVSGLHCEANMQILEASANIRKLNRWWPDMW